MSGQHGRSDLLGIQPPHPTTDDDAERDTEHGDRSHQRASIEPAEQVVPLLERRAEHDL